MSNRVRTVLTLIGEIARVDDADVSLAALARRSGEAPSSFHRRFRAVAGETPRQFAQRVRLERAAAELLSSRASILQIALAHGFASHEVFSRAFRRRFNTSPRQYRAAGADPARRTCAGVPRSISPCVGLFRMPLANRKERRPMPVPMIERQVLERPQPVLFIRRRLSADALQQTMGECFGALYSHGQAAGLAIAGFPIARYVSTGPGLWTVDFIMPLAAPATAVGDMQPDVLPAGPVAFAVHKGPYDSLPETNAAIERWIEENGYTVGGPPWEWYVTSPGEVPDPADWRTEVFWPLAGGGGS